MWKAFTLALVATQLSAITTDELAQWDQAAIHLVKTSHLEDGDSARLFAYLYSAQEQFAAVSPDGGSIGPISLHVLRLFNPHFKTQLPADDVLSTNLSAPLIEQIDARFKKEQAHLKAVAISTKAGIWKGRWPYNGLKIPSMKPWLMSRTDQFRSPAPPPPNDPFWNEQIQIVKKMMASATDEQKKRILYWASPKGDFKMFANAYMDQQQTPLQTRLEVRTRLSQAMADSLMSTFDSKYTYWVRRPNMIDKNLKPYIPTPNFPSYPAAHSAVGQTAATVLIYYFPENAEEWRRLSDEMGLSRIWAGIHFPIDHEEGQRLGEQVGLLR